jgi:DNA-directed RNA polymerase II subunit RPB2
MEPSPFKNTGILGERQEQSQSLLDGRRILDIYFKTNAYPYTRHHIDSYDQFLQKDLQLVIKSQNPIIILKDLIPNTNQYKYRVEINVGGTDASGIYIGSPTVSLQGSDEVRLMYPSEARLRNLTYASTVYADMHVKIIMNRLEGNTIVTEAPIEIMEPRFALFRIPIMLHSRYCVLHKKPKIFLQEVGECVYDHGGYFIIEGGEKVLVSIQEQAFNTLYTNLQNNDPDYSAYATITCFSPKTRITKRVSFGVDKKTGAIKVSIPFIRAPIPLFVLFRALGVQPDQDIVETIFPDLESPEAQLLLPHLISSVSDAYPFLTSYSAVQFMKTFTKGYSEAHVLDILHNQLFVHVDDQPGARVQTLGNYVRQLLRLVAGIDDATDKDNTRNQRCLVSGFSTQMLFQGIYALWVKTAALVIDKEYNFNPKLYQGINFQNIFASSNLPRMFAQGYITEALTKAFRGKWGSGVGEEKSGLIQVLSRLSYLDFMSHCRRVVLNFDTSLKLTGPRHLHPSQFGYYCTNETPGGASIGITKNLSILTMISTGMTLDPFLGWLRHRRFIYECNEVNAALRALYIRVELNGGIIGYTAQPEKFVQVLKLFKYTSWLPPFVSIGFDRQRRTVFIYADEGRPLRPLVIIENSKIPTSLFQVTTWRDSILGSDPERTDIGLDTSEFADPLAEVSQVTLEDYIGRLEQYKAPIEYIDPYEQNMAFIATFPEHILSETSHMEVHPSTMLSVVNSTIPYLNHNQSPRNQLGCSQSKQGVSLYCSNWKNRYDNQVHVLCYPQAPLVSTHYQRYFAEGRLNNGFNCIVALSMYAGYNQEDGIVMNADSIKRGMFRSIFYRSYEAFEENDKSTKTRFANPREVAGWNNIRPNLDYSKLDERGFIRVGEYIDEETVIAGRYILSGSQFKDSSVTPQVWTRGRVDDVVVIVGANGLRTVKIRVVQDRSPEIGDKFTNRHGQKGTIGMLIRSDDLPRTADGIVPDLIMNPHAIPSRMTIAQIMEQIMGKTSTINGYMGDGTAFSNEGSPADRLGDILEKGGAERFGNEILYNGVTGEQIPVQIFMCPLYNMRLKHMVEDKWNARGEGRREQRTHQPTGGRGNQGGLKIGELERDSLVCHGVTNFITESYMKRSDGTELTICNGCGRFPIYNKRLNIKVCPNCDGPVKFSGETSKNLEVIPPLHQSRTEFSTVEAPYVIRLLSQEMETYLNMPLRFLTSKDVMELKKPVIDPLMEGPSELPTLPELVLQDEREIEMLEEEERKVDEKTEKPEASVMGVPVPKEMLVDDMGSMPPSVTFEAAPAIEPLENLLGIQEEPVVQTEEGETGALNLPTAAEQPTENLLNIFGGPQQPMSQSEQQSNMNNIFGGPQQPMQQSEQQSNMNNIFGVPQPPQQQSNMNNIFGFTPQMQQQPVYQAQQAPQQNLMNFFGASQPQIQGQAQIFEPALPGAPGTFVVNTEPMIKNVTITQASQQPNLFAEASESRAKTPRRQVGFNEPAGSFGAGPVPPLTKINVTKLG